MKEGITNQKQIQVTKPLTPQLPSGEGMTPADHQQKNRLSNQKEMSLTARNKSIGNYSLRSESPEGKRDSSTRNTYFNAECYESREKELLVPGAWNICLRHIASLARIKALTLTCTPTVYLLPISHCSSYPTKVVARLLLPTAPTSLDLLPRHISSGNRSIHRPLTRQAAYDQLQWALISSQPSRKEWP